MWHADAWYFDDLAVIREWVNSLTHSVCRASRSIFSWQTEVDKTATAMAEDERETDWKPPPLRG